MGFLNFKQLCTMVAVHIYLRLRHVLFRVFRLLFFYQWHNWFKDGWQNWFNDGRHNWFKDDRPLELPSVARNSIWLSPCWRRNPDIIFKLCLRCVKSSGWPSPCQHTRFQHFLRLSCFTSLMIWHYSYWTVGAVFALYS